MNKKGHTLIALVTLLGILSLLIAFIIGEAKENYKIHKSMQETNAKLG